MKNELWWIVQFKLNVGTDPVTVVCSKSKPPATPLGQPIAPLSPGLYIYIYMASKLPATIQLFYRELWIGLHSVRLRLLDEVRSSFNKSKYIDTSERFIGSQRIGMFCRGFHPLRTIWLVKKSMRGSWECWCWELWKRLLWPLILFCASIQSGTVGANKVSSFASLQKAPETWLHCMWKWEQPIYIYITHAGETWYSVFLSTQPKNKMLWALNRNLVAIRKWWQLLGVLKFDLAGLFNQHGTCRACMHIVWGCFLARLQAILLVVRNKVTAKTIWIRLGFFQSRTPAPEQAGGSKQQGITAWEVERCQTSSIRSRKHIFGVVFLLRYLGHTLWRPLVLGLVLRIDPSLQWQDMKPWP